MSDLDPRTNQPGSPEKDPITCHVLDITTGLPAVSIAVVLKPIYPAEDLIHRKPGPEPVFRAETNADGRITRWKSDERSLWEVMIELMEVYEKRTSWLLTFDTERYFGEGKGFFPEVEVRFYVDNDVGHVHVPLLVGPYSYTTYRGS